MYKNLSEIAAHKKRLRSNVAAPKKFFFPCRLLRLVTRNSFLYGTVFLYFTKVAVAIHSSMDGYGVFRRALAAMNCVYTMYVTDI